MFACFATFETVMGLSPEMTLTVTPCSAKYEKVSGAWFRMRFRMQTKATGSTRYGSTQGLPDASTTEPL